MSLPHEITSRTYAGSRKAIADATGMKLTMVEKFCLAPPTLDGNGKASPVEQVINAYRALCVCGEHAKAAELVGYINRECDRLDVPLSAKADPKSLDCIAATTKEFSDILARFAEAHGDGRFDATDAEKLLPEVEDLMRVLVPLARTCQQMIVDAEEARERDRRGPHRTMPRFFQLRRTGVVA